MKDYKDLNQILESNIANVLGNLEDFKSNLGKPKILTSSPEFLWAIIRYYSVYFGYKDHL